MASYQEIESLKEIRQHQRILSLQAMRQAAYALPRSIGYPSGQFRATVHFAAQNGPSVIWWLSRAADSGDHWLNLVGRGDPAGHQLLLIDLQLNMVSTSFHRRLGGTFVREDETGMVFVAHRGIVTRGMSRVSWDRLVALTTERPVAVRTSGGPRSMFLVASLESECLLSDIAGFAQEVRSALDRADPTAESVSFPATARRRSGDLFEISLRAFDDEFVGTRQVPAREAQIAVVRHGSVVRQLRELLRAKGAIQQSQKVDLFFSRRRGEALLFEVKTGLDTTSLYTAVGQLFMHSAALSGHVNDRVIRKVLVIPGLPTTTFRDRVRKQIGIEILTYGWKQDGSVAFESLKQIGLT